MNSLNTLVSFNHAFMSYKDFLFNKQNTLRENKENIKILEILFTCLNIILNQDRINTKDENKAEYIDENILESIISIIASKNNDLYYLNNKSFSNPEEIIKFIRNKIAHGEFYIDQKVENIVLKNNDEEIFIPIKDLYSLSIALIERIELYTVSESYERTQLTSSLFSTRRITNKNQINDLLDNIHFIEYKFVDNSGINPQKKYIIEEILRQLPLILDSQKKELSIEEMSTIIKRIFSANNIDVNLKISPLSTTAYTNKLKEFILVNFDNIKQLDLRTQILLVSNWYQKLINDNKKLENINNGIHYNLLTITSIQDFNAKNSLEVIKKIESSNLFSSILEMILTTELLGFYIHYQYPLENVCKRKDNIENETEFFDYGKLDLSMLKPTIFQLPSGTQDSYSSAVLASKKRLNLLNIEISKLEKQFTNLRRIIKECSEEEKDKYEKALKLLSEKTNIVIEKQKVECESLLEREKRLSEFTSEEELYYHNRYLIEYIRNAISHGNVQFFYSDTETSLEKCTLRFINKKDDQVTLDLNITVENFEKIFSQHNLEILDQFLQDQQKSKKIS